ncbi:MAG: 2-hydroxyacyl-CoA dehydratase [Candidatus Heimdallarchaeota archaeon]|nr:2-hydroxyacyl-CoA dehydratase [Candidatus Heimdallarchaeota archaeon]
MSQLLSELDSIVNKYHDYVSNKQSILYFTADIPLELIHAAALHPVRIPSDISFESNKSTNAIFQPFICSKSRFMLDFVLNNEIQQAIFSENHCDSLQNLNDVLKMNNALPENFNSFRFLLPVNRGGQTAKQYYVHELQRLVSWLERITNSSIGVEEVKKSIALYNSKREYLNKLTQAVRIGKIDNKMLYRLKIVTDILPIDEAILKLKKAVESLPDVSSEHETSVILSGSMFDNFTIFDKIPTLNENVVFDDLSFGSRSSLFKISDHGDTMDQLLENIAQAYIVDRVPDSVHFYPNKRKQFLLDKYKETGAKGVIFIYYSFCDPDAFETRNLARYLEEKHNIPILSIVTDPELSNKEQLTTRIEAFLERIGDH